MITLANGNTVTTAKHDKPYAALWIFDDEETVRKWQEQSTVPFVCLTDTFEYTKYCEDNPETDTPERTGWLRAFLRQHRSEGTAVNWYQIASCKFPEWVNENPTLADEVAALISMPFALEVDYLTLVTQDTVLVRKDLLASPHQIHTKTLKPTDKMSLVETERGNYYATLDDLCNTVPCFIEFGEVRTFTSSAEWLYGYKARNGFAFDVVVPGIVSDGTDFKVEHTDVADSKIFGKVEVTGKLRVAPIWTVTTENFESYLD